MGSEALQIARTATPSLPLEIVGGGAATHEPARPAAESHTPPPASRDRARRAAEFVGEAVSNLNHGIRYEIDETTDTVVTKVIDRETNKVIRQIPPEEVLEVAQRVRRYIGVLLDIEI
jgi:flagellar protein FlaG